MNEIVQAPVATDEELFAVAFEAERQGDEAESDARWRAADAYAELSRRGYTQQKIAKRMRCSQAHISKCIACVVKYSPENNRPIFQEPYRELSGKNVHFSSDTDEWATPQDLFDLLNAEFAFTTDVCATPENAKCAEFFTKDTDALLRDWEGSCWMNPPYGSEIGFWVEKAFESAQAGGATVVCLLPARVDTAWWWDYCRYGEIRFLRGRLKFGDGENSAPFPSAVVVFARTPKVVWWERS